MSKTAVSKEDLLARQRSDNRLGQDPADPQAQPGEASSPNAVDADVPEDGGEPKEPPLTPEQVEALRKEALQKLKSGLSGLSRTGDRTSFAYVVLNAKEKELTDTYGFLSQFKHVRYLNLSKNKLTSLMGIEAMRHLRELEASDNQLTTAAPLTDSTTFMQLERVDLSGNQLATFSAQGLQRLRHLILTNNQLTSLDCQGLTSLTDLEVRKNKLTTIENIAECVHLKRLFCAENQLKSLDFVRNLHGLEHVHARDNQIANFAENLAAGDFPSLKYLNLRKNQIPNFKSLEFVWSLPNIDILNFLGNPFLEGFEGNPIEVFVQNLILDSDFEEREVIRGVYVQSQQG